MYQRTNNPLSVKRIADNAFIPFDPANTDYANFKRDILSGTATLQDADGNTLSSASAITYVNQLP